MKKLIILSLIITFLLPLIACSSQTYGEGYNAGFDEGYSKGWQDGYNKGFEEASISREVQIPSSPTKIPATLGELTLEDAEYVLNLLPLLPATFDNVDAASEGMSNADLELGDDASEVQLFISDEPFQMIYGILLIGPESRVERASFDAIMNDEAMIRQLLIESIIAGALEEGVEITEPEIQITYPKVGDAAFLGEGYLSTFGIDVGVDILWFRIRNTYVFLQSMYYSPEREILLPIAKEVELRLSQYSL